MSRNQAMGPVWVFDESRLEQALAAYAADALAAYPQQAERIQTTVLAMRDFLHSAQATELRMRLGDGQ